MATSSEGFSTEDNWDEKHGFLTPDISVRDWNLAGYGAYCDEGGRVIEVDLGNF